MKLWTLLTFCLGFVACIPLEPRGPCKSWISSWDQVGTMRCVSYGPAPEPTNGPAPEPTYVPEPSYERAPEPSYETAPEPTYVPEPIYVPEPSYKPAPKRKPRLPVWLQHKNLRKKLSTHLQRTYKEPSYIIPEGVSCHPFCRRYLAALEIIKKKNPRRPSYDSAPEPSYVPAPEPSYAPAPEPSYVPAPEPSYDPAPEPSYVPAPEPSYVPVPEPSYDPAPEPSYVSAPEPSYRGNNNLDN